MSADDPNIWGAAALDRAEEIGVYEYQVNGKYMEYWSFFGVLEGWYFIRYDLEAKKEVFRGANIPWDEDARIPMFLMSGGVRYNYMTG